jgi:hypothetical protein
MRQPNILRPIKLNTTLPEDIRTKLDLHLWSDVEGRVPKGAYQRFFLDRIREYFDHRTLDLAEYCDCPVSAPVRGSPATIDLLRALLRR